jgi:hypothetical protein
MTGIFFTIWGIINLPRRTLLHGINFLSCCFCRVNSTSSSMSQSNSSYSRPCCGKTGARVCLYWEQFIGFSALVAVAWIMIGYSRKEKNLKVLTRNVETSAQNCASLADARNICHLSYPQRVTCLLGCQKYSFHGYILYIYIYINSPRTPNIGKNSPQISLHCVVETTFQRMSHAVGYINSCKRWKCRYLALLGLMK